MASKQEKNALRQQADVKMRIEDALARLQGELDAEMAQGGEHTAWRISRAEVLRRAGNVNKNTLKKPYHRELDQKIDDFVRRALEAQALPAPAIKHLSVSLDLNHYTQMLAAAEILRDSALERVEELEARIRLLASENKELAIQVATLKGSASNVVPIQRGKAP